MGSVDVEEVSVVLGVVVEEYVASFGLESIEGKMAIAPCTLVSNEVVCEAVGGTEG